MHKIFSVSLTISLTSTKYALIHNLSQTTTHTHTQNFTIPSFFVVVFYVIEFIQLETGKLILNREVVNLKDKIENVIQIVSRLIENKNIEYKTEFGPGVPPFIIGDRLRLRQILTSLISNAAKFTERGSVTVTVTLESAQTFEEENRSQLVKKQNIKTSSQSSSLLSSLINKQQKTNDTNETHKRTAKYDQYLKIAVTDTGIGIDPSVVKDLFTTFHQVHSVSFL